MGQTVVEMLLTCHADASGTGLPGPAISEWNTPPSPIGRGAPDLTAKIGLWLERDHRLSTTPTPPKNFPALVLFSANRVVSARLEPTW